MCERAFGAQGKHDVDVNQIQCLPVELATGTPAKRRHSRRYTHGLQCRGMDPHTCTLVNTRTLFEANNQAPVHTFENVARTPHSLQSIEHFIAHERARKFDCRHYRRNVDNTYQHLELEPESFAAEQHLRHSDVWVIWQSLPQV